MALLTSDDLISRDIGGWRHPETHGFERPDLNPLPVARAIAASPVWSEMPDSILIVRTQPNPALAVLGNFEDAEAARVAALRGCLDDVLAHLRYVTYSEAEENCKELAAALLARFGPDGIRRMQFAAIPRGGFIVLGMLSYALGLDRGQLEAPPSPDAPLVIVDDCAFSGVRFAHFLKRVESKRVVFATLYSHPDLRRAIEAREPRVDACISARDLADFAPSRFGDLYESWLEHARSVSDWPRYWTGQTEHLCFAWSEPDYNFWNPVTGELESGWRLIPPELCLKNRPLSEGRSIPIQVQLEGKGPLRPARRVVFGEFEGRIVIGDLEKGKSFGLVDAAAGMWKTIVEFGNFEDAANRLLPEYEVEEATLRTDLQSFIDDLVGRGLLEENGIVD